MFDWLGLAPNVVQIIGCVLIGLGCILLVFLIVIMVKSFKEIKNEKISQKQEQTQKVETSAITETAKSENENLLGNNYLAKLKKLTDEEKTYYTDIKNAVLSYNNFINTLTVDGETFKYFNRTFGAITIKNGSLKVYLKLSKKDLDQRFNNEPSEYKKYQRTPMEFVLDKDVELRKAKKSLTDLAEELELEKAENYKDRTFQTLIKKFD